MGAWISYGLGTENESLPSFVTINPTLGHGGVRNFGSAFLPPIHQATRIATSRHDGKTTAEIQNLAHPQSKRDVQLLQLELLKDLTRHKERTVAPRSPDGDSLSAAIDAEMNARIDSFELAFKMQTEAPEIFDLSGETESTRKLYGIDEEPTSNFGTQCLLARRLSDPACDSCRCRMRIGISIPN